MKKNVFKKFMSMVLALTIMSGLAFVISSNNEASTSNALTGISGGKNLSNIGMDFTNYYGEITSKYVDGSVRSIKLDSSNAIFHYNPVPNSDISIMELTLKEKSGRIVSIGSIPGSYGGPIVGYVPTNLYQFSLPNYGTYDLTASVKDIYGYLYNRTVTITYLNSSGIKFVGYWGDITSYPDGTAQKATISSSSAVFSLEPNAIPSTLSFRDPYGRVLPVGNVAGSYGGPNIGYIPSGLYSISFSSKGVYKLSCVVKNEDGTKATAIIDITYK